MKVSAFRKICVVMFCFWHINTQLSVCAAAIPVLNIATLKRDAARFTTNRAIIDATVAIQLRPGTLYLRDDTGALLAVLATNRVFRAGDRVRVEGLISLEGFSPYLVKANARAIGRAPPPQPREIGAKEGLSGRADAELVQITGRVLGRPDKVGDRWTLQLDNEDTVCRVEVLNLRQSKSLSFVEPRSTIRVVGACSVGKSEGLYNTFRVIAASPDAVTVVKAAPWLNLQRAITLLSITGVIGLAVLLWSVTLQRKLAEQAVMIRQQAEEQAAKLERTVMERTASLNQANKDLEIFCSGVSHDLRAPLRTMQSFSQILLEDHGSEFSDEARTLMGRVVKASQKLSTMVDDLLDYSRVASSEVTVTAADLDGIVDDVIAENAHLQPPNALISVQRPLGVVLAHASSIQQALTNLLQNAVKFARDGAMATVTVSSRRNGQMIRVSVQDNGIGIAREQLDQIFGLFHRGANSVDGSGVGLAIVKRFVEKMGGRVGVESELGKGSTFWFELRAAERKE
jgi:signal transduction histidine kinase